MPKSQKKPLVKPRKDFPLTPHKQGYWCKKIKGKLVYIGPRWCDAATAEAIWNRDKRFLLQGEDPADYDRDGYTVGDLCEDFKAYKAKALEQGTIVTSTYQDYVEVCKLLVDGRPKTATKKAVQPLMDKDIFVDALTTSDFDRLRAAIGVLGDGRPASNKTINNRVLRIKSVFSYGLKAGKYDTPVRFGLEFKQVPDKVMRLERLNKPKKLFSVAQLKALLEAANPQFRAMILMGINCGFGNADVGTVTLDKIDLETGWHDFHRMKTAVERRCWLWPETVSAIKLWLTQREKRQAVRLKKSPAVAKEFEASKRFVFLTCCGLQWFKLSRANPVSVEFRKLNPPTGLGFYALRHSFETIGGESRDQVAVDHIMGHAAKKNDMAAVYRESIDDKRLKDVSQHVRKHYKKALK